jgi:hypothetical protein
MWKTLSSIFNRQIITINDTSNESNPSKVCLICRSNDSTNIITIGCHSNHLFHFDCIMDWWLADNCEKRGYCPLCKQEVKKFAKNHRVDSNLIMDLIKSQKRVMEILNILFLVDFIWIIQSAFTFIVIFLQSSKPITRIIMSHIIWLPLLVNACLILILMVKFPGK